MGVAIPARDRRPCSKAARPCVKALPLLLGTEDENCEAVAPSLPSCPRPPSRWCSSSLRLLLPLRIPRLQSNLFCSAVRNDLCPGSCDGPSNEAQVAVVLIIPFNTSALPSCLPECALLAGSEASFFFLPTPALHSAFNQRNS